MTKTGLVTRLRYAPTSRTGDGTSLPKALPFDERVKRIRTRRSDRAIRLSSDEQRWLPLAVST